MEQSDENTPPCVPSAPRQPVPPPPSHPSAGPRRSSGRRLVESACLLVCALLILRAVAVEPYGVPTGSMAPVLLGNHRSAPCSRCGYPVHVGLPNGRQPDRHAARTAAVCPNCGCDEMSLESVPVCRGDQLLVNKNIYDWRRPRRWEMAVFRCPVDPGKEFVKRVVGLPGETVLIRDGDVYIDHEIARKTLAELKRLRVGVFDNNFQPAPDGWGLRWEVQPPGAAASLEGTSLYLDARQAGGQTVWMTYRHWLLDLGKEEPIRDEYCYNGGDYASRSAVHDFLLECDVEVLSGEGWVAFGITDGLDELVAELPVGPLQEGARLVAPGAEEIPYRTAPTVGLSAGRTYRIELAFVDRRATLAIDGRRPFAPLDRPAGEERARVTRPVKVGTRGVEVRVRNLRIFRDVCYTDAGRHGTRAPVRLGAGQYFVLGDNSPSSDDSRFWSDAEGKPLTVPETSFVGRPFLVHLPGRINRGQAFGREWQFQGIDWGRIRWLR